MAHHLIQVLYLVVVPSAVFMAVLWLVLVWCDMGASSSLEDLIERYGWEDYESLDPLPEFTCAPAQASLALVAAENAIPDHPDYGGLEPVIGYRPKEHQVT